MTEKYRRVPQSWKSLKLGYSSPELIFLSVAVDMDGVTVHVIGGDGEGAYEWVIEREGIVERHSNCGYGAPEWALRDGLIEHCGPSQQNGLYPEEAAQILKRWSQDVPVTAKDRPIIEKLSRIAGANA